LRTQLKSPSMDGSGGPVDNQTKMTEQWLVRQCPYCDDHGYLPNGFRCPHESPEVLAERARRGANLARAQLLPLTDNETGPAQP
jgi:hypothetical protein